MQDKVFLDTNIIIYLYSIDEPEKRRLCENLAAENHIVISAQVISEMCNILNKKMRLDFNSISKVVDELTQVFIVRTVDTETIKFALIIAEKYRYSYFDSLIIAAAIKSGCSVLYTEDMQDGQIIEDSLKIINPFRSMENNV
jgi:predicted nucleic acid-binding protein